MLKNNQRTIDFQNTRAKSDFLRQNATNLLFNFQNTELMSSKIAVVLEKRRKKANGKFPVKIRFNFKCQAHYINTGIEVPEANFTLGKVVGMPKASLMNTIIAQKLDYTQSVLDDLQLRGLIKTKFKTGGDIKRFIESGENVYDEKQDPNKAVLFFKSYVQNHAKKYSNRSSANQYIHMLNKVGEFADLDLLFLQDINVAFLKDFEIFCQKSGMTTNGIGNYMRSIRTVYNDAIDRDLIGIDKYPFRRFKIKKAKTIHRNVNVKDLRFMLNFDYDDLKERLKANAKKYTSKFPDVKKYVDLWFLSFYFCGMNIKDILFLKHNDIRNNELSIIRFKSGEQIIIRVEPEAWNIIKMYPGKKYLLSFLDEYSTDDYKNVESRMNENLKFVLPYITGYWARHTWATIASKLDVPDPIVDIAQGRTVKGMAGIYIARNMGKITEANRKVIDYLFSK